jgi:squalene-hopene/tetraprenyl-beta-curcumene cyclase
MRLTTMMLGLSLTLLPAIFAGAAEADKAKAVAEARQVADRALKYLVAQQKPSGSFQRSDREPPAVTALVLQGLAHSPDFGARSEAAQKAVAYLAGVQQANGGIYRDMLANYNTAIAISALAALDDPAQKDRIDRAVGYLKGVQFSDAIAGAKGAKIDPSLAGGWSYGGPRGGAPDVSNTAIVLDALHDSGLKPDDPAYQNALKFLSKLQNNSETNPAKWAGNDGGFIYNPGSGGEGNSAAGEFTTADGKRALRSYGSMTYAGLKSMIYAGLSKDDPRVKAAWGWVESHWTLDEHPGMREAGADTAKDGIFYYYNTLAKALAVYGEPVIKDKTGQSHDWRLELIAKLASIQKPDGSFAGQPKWMEDSPIIATAMATLAVETALADLEKK